MPDFIIKTVHDRNLVIEADRYNWNATENAYEFFKKDENANTQKVAVVPYSPEVLAIVENNAEKADFYDRFDVNEEETDDVCLGCRFQEFLDSDEFRSAVFELVDFYNGSDNGEEDEVAQ